MSSRWLRFLSRVGVAIVILLAVVILPLIFLTPRWFDLFLVPVAVLLFIIYVGKLLIDTFFYSRY